MLQETQNLATMNITLIPAIILGHHNYSKSPDIRLDELSYTIHLIDQIHTQLLQSTKHTPFITINKHTGTRAEILEQLNQQIHLDAASTNLVIAVGLNASIGDGRYHTSNGWTVINSPQSKESAALAIALARASIDNLGSKAISPQGQISSRRFLNQAEILSNLKCPAVLTLNLYQDNRQDIHYLLSSAGHQAIVDLHVKGIMTYLGLNP